MANKQAESLGAKVESMIQPTLEMRLKMRERPQQHTPVLYEKWQSLLFLHWEYDPQAIQRTLPNGLYVDTFEGKAYLGIIPFLMRDVRSRFVPAVFGGLDFEELNVRTYVYDRAGTPGVWFYSLDANHYIAGPLARLLFNLPYFHARITAESQPDTQEISFSSYRYRTEPTLNTHFRYHPISEPFLAIPGSLEFFLIERYVLFACSKGHKLYSGRVWHNPYKLTDVELSDCEEHVLRPAGFGTVTRDANHKIMSQGVEVDVFALKEVN